MISPQVLHRYPFFAGLTREQIVSLAKIARLVQFEAGSIILEEGSTATYLYIVQNGKVGVFLHLGPDRDIRVDLTTIVAGEMVGWSALLSAQRTATAQALTDTNLIAINAEALHALFEKDRDLAFKITWQTAEVLADRLNRMHYQLASVFVPEPHTHPE